MRRRPRDDNGPGVPPAELLTFTGSTNREKFAWINARRDWWDSTHAYEQVGDLQWLMDGWDQVGGDLDWCGSIGAPCADHDCLCWVWPEQLEMYEGIDGEGGVR